MSNIGHTHSDYSGSMQTSARLLQRAVELKQQRASGELNDSEATAKSSRLSKEEEELSQQQKRQVSQLQSIDIKVRTHEQAHLNAAGSLAVSRARFEYQVGPDDRKYAVAGEVQIDTSRVPGDPIATIAKSEHIIRAALAPAEPSTQDQRVASDASRMRQDARSELAKMRYEETQQSSEEGSEDSEETDEDGESTRVDARV